MSEYKENMTIQDVTMKPIILMRKSLAEEEEYQLASQFFPIVEHRTECKDNLVIGRYSCLPYYQELEKDLQNNGCKLINTYAQHRWIANFDYYDELKEYTPQTWTEQDFCYCEYDGPFVVKGRTNSRKHDWNKMMFAKTKREAVEIGCRLNEDMLIGNQGILYRKYIPLKTFEYGINGLPFSNEWRFFYFGDTCLSSGYYWSISEHPEKGVLKEAGLELADKVAKIAKNYVNFFVMDIAETETGEWILIEMNDGQMSGLSMNKAEVLYGRLKCLIVENDNEKD